MRVDKSEMSRLSNWIDKGLRFTVKILLSVAFIVIIMQVFMRYVVGHPLTWSEVLARMIFIWMMMLGIPIMFCGRTYLAFDLLLGSLPNNIRKWVQLFIDFLMLVFCVYNVYNSGNLILHTSPSRLTPNVQVPYVVMYSSLFISMLLSSIIMGDHLRLSIRRCLKKEG